MSNLERVINKFSANQAPFFLIVDGRYACVGKNVKHDDVSEAADRLKSFLEELDADSKSVYKIYCYDKLPAGQLRDEVKKIINKGDHDYLLSYCAWMPKEKEPVSTDVSEARAQWKFERMQKEQELRNEIAEIKALLLQKNIEESAEEEEEEIEQEMQPNNILGALINNPQIQQAIATGVVGMLGNFLTPAGKPVAMAGVSDNTDDERIFNAIETLKQYDDQLPDHLEKLATMAATETTKFKFLLSYL
jgi:hypothetical protein